MGVFEGLKPEAVWGYFEEICQVPRPSKKEGKIIAYLLDWAKKHNLKNASRAYLLYKEMGFDSPEALATACDDKETCNQRKRKCTDRDFAGSYGYGLREKF